MISTFGNSLSAWQSAAFAYFTGVSYYTPQDGHLFVDQESREAVTSILRISISRIIVVLLAVLLCGSSAGANSQRAIKRAPLVKPKATRVYQGLLPGAVMVKFADDAGVYASGGRLYGRDGTPIHSVNTLIDQHLVQRAASALATDKASLSKWRERGEQASQLQLPDLTSYFKLALAAGKSIADAARIADQLNLDPQVELAFLRGQPEEAGDIAPPTPSFDTAQAYLYPAPGGVDAFASWGYPGGKGEGVTICDVEIGWQYDHEDLSAAASGLIGAQSTSRDHGTAVLGVMIADSSNYGVTGISYGASARMVSVSQRSVEDALLLAAENLSPGDLILIELHQPGPNSNGSGQYGYVPMEWTPSIFDVIQVITASGYVVCEAAGNGSQNLNDAVYNGWFDTTKQHSGAIMIGAGAPPSGIYGPDRSRLSFSNYGSRVDLQGYGYGVVTTGYGDLFDPGDERQLYTAGFSGTSSASPIVTASVACVQGRFKAVTGGYTMTAKEIGDLLKQTGSPQTGILSEHIGPRPDLGAAIPLVAQQSAYANPRSFYASLLDPNIVTDTMWLINPNVSPTTFNIAVQDSVAVFARTATEGTWTTKDEMRAANLSPTLGTAFTNWIYVNPTISSIPPGDSVPVEITFDGSVLSASYFGQYYKARLDVATIGDLGSATIAVPLLALAQDSLHGDTIEVQTSQIRHRATSETNIRDWLYVDDSATNFLYDASFVVARRNGADTTAFRDIFGTQLWRGLDFWVADSVTFPGYTTWYDSTQSEDGRIGLTYEVWVPTVGDSADFVLWRTTVYGRMDQVPLATYGIAADWDLPATSGANNFGAYDTTRQMIYQTGNTGLENNAAGMALLRAPAFGGVVGSNPADVYPTGGFTDGGLYDQMRTPGFRVDGSNIDLHTILTAFYGTIPTGAAMPFEFVMLSSRTGVPGLEAAYARAQHLSDTLRYISCPIALTGDVNEDGILSAADIIYLVNYVFKAGSVPQPIELSGDVDCSGSVTSADIIFMVGHVFKSGPAPCDACMIY